MKKLPIGIQSIRDILTEGYVYIDKTQFALDLIQNGKHYFLSRPRRFGKSLFVSTLKEIFLGKKELFVGCQIYKSAYKWPVHPVLHLNLAEVLNETTQEFKDSLQRSLTELAAEHETKVEIPSAQEGLKYLVKALSKKNRVVVLVDEYDKPIIDNLNQPEVAEGNRHVLQNFFGALKNLEEYVRFTFVTGISRFSKVSLFSGPNHLNDITMDPQCATMMGYTQEELVVYFAEHIKAIAQERSGQGEPFTEQDVLTEIRAWYNGYRFTEAARYVYNPFSTLKFLKAKKPKSYWYATGTPTFLINQIQKHPNSLVPLAGIKAEESELMSVGSLKEIDLKALMFQAGYLTIAGYSTLSNHYQLDFPNQEVGEAFAKSLVKQFAPLSIDAAAQSKQALKEQDLTLFFEQLQVALASFPYQLFIEANERTYHTMLLSLLSGMGLEVAAETPSSLGRVDLLIELPTITYVMELKLDSTPEAALEQIYAKQYHVPYLKQGKEVALVGLNFSSKTRNIATWTGELLDEHGAPVRKLTPQEVNRAEGSQVKQQSH